jgi:hypothetical protein
MEEQPPILMGSCDYIDKQSLTADKGAAFQLGGWAKC